MAKKKRRVPKYAQREEAAKPPPKRIPADLSQQAPNNSYGPPLFYEDVTFTCRDCGSVEVWTAEAQKHYYEVLKGPIYGSAVRCRPCRQKRRARIEEQRRGLERSRGGEPLPEPGEGGDHRPPGPPQSNIPPPA
jgi:hypothetical protein